MGRLVPEDLSVIGFDDIPRTSWRSYELTTIAQSFETLTEAVLAALDHELGQSVVTNVPVTLIEGNTVRG
jgi:DNA-binding LacI/PurR family transcriptional regulator